MLTNTSVDETDSPSSFMLGISTFRDHISAQFFDFSLLRPANCDQKMRRYSSLFFYQADHPQLSRTPAFHVLCFLIRLYKCCLILQQNTLYWFVWFPDAVLILLTVWLQVLGAKYATNIYKGFRCSWRLYMFQLITKIEIPNISL